METIVSAFLRMERSTRFNYLCLLPSFLNSLSPHLRPSSCTLWILCACSLLPSLTPREGDRASMASPTMHERGPQPSMIGSLFPRQALVYRVMQPHDAKGDICRFAYTIRLVLSELLSCARGDKVPSEKVLSKWPLSEQIIAFSS